MPVITHYVTGCMPVITLYITGCMPVITHCITGCMPVIALYITGCMPIIDLYITGCMSVITHYDYDHKYITLLVANQSLYCTTGCKRTGAIFLLIANYYRGKTKYWF